MMSLSSVCVNANSYGKNKRCLRKVLVAARRTQRASAACLCAARDKNQPALQLSGNPTFEER